MKKKRWLLLIAMLIAVMMLPLTANAAVKLNKKKVTLTVGKTVQLKVKGTKTKVKWSTTNKNVAVVNKKGKVSAKSAGSATIKAKVGKMTLKCKVTVNAPVTPAPAPAPAPAPTPTPTPEPSLSASSIELIAGQQKQLTLNNASGNVAWSSSNFRIADVASDGTVYAKFYGTCTIKATCGGKSYSCAVSVKLPTPKCYPQKGFSFPENGVEVRFDVFEAQFVAYRPVAPDIQALTYENQYTSFNPFVYKIHLKGHLETAKGSNANRQFYICVTHMWEGQMNDVTDYMTWISPVTDQNGDFELTKEVQLCGPAESIFLVLGYV